MKLYGIIPLCLVVLLPCILGDDGCICEFPDYLSGSVTIGPKYKTTLNFFESVKDGLFTWTSFGRDELVDLKNKKEYYWVEEDGCFQYDIDDIDGFSYTIPKCVPSTAVQDCGEYDTNEPGVVCYKEEKENIWRIYKVKNTGEGKCMPWSIYSDYHRYKEPDTYEIHSIKEDTAKDREFYTRILEHDENPCDLSQIAPS